jgi:TATA-box binding protein (TBP) (component of TFIID and TFIIIB)
MKKTQPKKKRLSKYKVNRKRAKWESSKRESTNSDYLERKKKILDVLEINPNWKFIKSDDEIKSICAGASEPVIHNQVCYFDCGTTINIGDLAWVGYGKNNRQKFKAMCSIKFPYFTCLVFKKGSVVIVGAKGFYYGLAAARVVCLHLSKRLGIPIEMRDFTVCNMQCVSSLNRSIDLKKLHDVCSISTYNPEQIKNVTIPITDRLYEGTRQDSVASQKLATFLVYSSGQIVVLGACDPEMAIDTISSVLIFIANFVE